MILFLGILFIGSISAQDDSRWTVYSGYGKIKRTAIGKTKNKPTILRIGLERKHHWYNNTAIYYGLDYNQGNLASLYNSSGDMKIKFTTLYFGLGGRFLADFLKISLGGERSFELSHPTKFTYIPIKGWGVFSRLNADIHLSKDLALSIQPYLKFRSIAGGDGEYRPNSHFEIVTFEIYREAGVNLALSYKIW